MDNQHAAAIPENILAAALTKFDEAFALLTPYLVILTADQRRELLKMGPKTLEFVEKAFFYAQQNPTLVPPLVNMDKFNIDYTDAHGLWSILNRARQVEEGLENTAMVAGSEAYQAALLFYNYIKLCTDQGVAGAEAIYDELRKRFTGGKRNSGETETETVTETVKKSVSVS